MRRRSASTGYVPYGLKYNVGGFDPKALQMAEQRQHAVLEIARVAGVDPEELGVSMTSRTYANQFDRRKAFTDFTLGQYRHAVEDRLSMGDVTPRGKYVKFNLDAFLRSDPAARYAAYAAGLRRRPHDDDIARIEDKPAGSVQAPQQQPARDRHAAPHPTQETA
jgi:phage portal protein BeeE